MRERVRLIIGPDCILSWGLSVDSGQIDQCIMGTYVDLITFTTVGVFTSFLFDHGSKGF